MDDAKLFENLRDLEAHVLGLPATADRSARNQAIEGRRAKLADARAREPDDTFSVSLPDPWQLAIFFALTRRYGLRPHRHARQRRSTVVVTAPVSFCERILWPEFVGITCALGAWFDVFSSRTARGARRRPGADRTFEALDLIARRRHDAFVIAAWRFAYSRGVSSCTRVCGVTHSASNVSSR